MDLIGLIIAIFIGTIVAFAFAVAIKVSVDIWIQLLKLIFGSFRSVFSTPREK